VNHPNVVYIFGAAEIDGTSVISMELVSGGTLKDRVQQQGPMQPADAVDAILQVIAGLEAAATVGILHRDVKPSNCFIDPRNHVKIGDFGLSISTLRRADSTLTEAGTFLGTPAFAAPEQLRGEALDVRSDIYAVGATLFYLLTGRAPIEETDLVRLVARIGTEHPPSPKALQPTVPQGLGAVVLRCLAKDPAKRYATYAGLAEELRPFSSSALAPAPLPLRAVAFMLDSPFFLFAFIGHGRNLATPLEDRFFSRCPIRSDC
jgi:serine/threonine protein kinase